MATMLDCKKIQPQIGEYIDGALGGDEAWGIKLHLSSCAVCTKIADELTATATLLRSLPTLEPSASFEVALAARLADQALKPRRPSLWSRFCDSLPVMPRLHPAFTAGVALAALVPAAFFVTGRMNTPTASDSAANPSARQNATKTVGSDTTLDELWREHSSYASSEPLADPAGMLQARSTPTSLPNIADLSL